MTRVEEGKQNREKHKKSKERWQERPTSTCVGASEARAEARALVVLSILAEPATSEERHVEDGDLTIA